MKKIIKNYLRIKSKTLHDFKNYHLFSSDINLSNFNFKNNFKNNLSNNSLKRLINYCEYITNKKKNIKIKKDLWHKNNYKNKINELINIFLSKDYNKITHTIENLGKTTYLSGFGPTRIMPHEYQNPKLLEKEKKYFFDYLISLNEYFGDIKVANPEQGGWIVENENVKFLIKSILKKKIKIFDTPNFYYGYNYKNTYFYFKDLKGIYAAERIKNILKIFDLNEIKEIGAGIGYSCFYLCQKIKKNYTLYDIPHASLLQAVFLLNSFGDNYVHLDNEPKNKKSKIFIKPYWKLLEDQHNKKTLWFNEDSLPEIDIETGKRYMDIIEKTPESFFLSINQEANNDYGYGIKQHRVIDLIKNSKSLYRLRDFLRPGYIEELYKIK